jgi:hypothetical protein
MGWALPSSFRGKIHAYSFCGLVLGATGTETTPELCPSTRGAQKLRLPRIALVWFAVPTFIFSPMVTLCAKFFLSP